MQKYLTISLFLLSMISMAGCAVIGGIFKAGVWVGILAVVVVVVVIIFIVRAISNNDKS